MFLLLGHCSSQSSQRTQWGKESICTFTCIFLYLFPVCLEIMSSQWYLKFQPSPSMIHSSFLFFHIYSFTHSENLSPIIYNIFTYLLNIPVCNQYLLRSLLTSLWLWHAWVLDHILSIPPQGPCSSCLGFSTQCPLHLSFFSQKDTFFTLLSSDTTCGVLLPSLLCLGSDTPS